MTRISDAINILSEVLPYEAGFASADVGRAIELLKESEQAISDLLSVSQHILTRWQLEDPKAVFPGHALQKDLELAILKVKSHA